MIISSAPGSASKFDKYFCSKGVLKVFVTRSGIVLAFSKNPNRLPLRIYLL
jgi:hypothetical protein